MIVLSSPKSRIATWAILTILLSVFTAAAALAADPVMEDPDPNDMRLLRNPDIHGDIIVFTYGGDLWTVSAQGGQASRLTGSVGFQNAPKFSPDGTTIAFSGNYDGNHDVYTIPAGGGEPARLTWHPGWDRVIDWQPDGASVRFQSPRESHTGRDLQLYTVGTNGGLPRKAILPTAGLSSYSPDGKKIAYNRITREHRTWKRYKGGMAQDIWIYDFDANDTQKITDWVGSDHFPMWSGDKIYYTSDQSGRLQIWVYDTVSSEHRQVTEHDEYDVKYPSQGPGAIVYENGGRLFVLDLASEETRQVTVSLFSDNVLTRPTIKDVGDRIGGGDLSPDANRAVFSARGDIFTVPAEKGNIRNLTATPGVREREAVWSPDGKTHRVTTDFTEDGWPCFDDEGKYLFFVSAQNFNPTLGGFDLKPLWTNMDGLYLVTLRDDVEHPFPPESDEAEVNGDEDDEDSSDDDDKDKKDKDSDEEKSEEKEIIRIDLEGLSNRMVELDITQGNYFNLNFAEGKLFYSSRPFTAGGGRGGRGAGSDIMVFDMEEREAEKVLPKVGGWTLSGDGKKILYASNGTFGIIDAKADQKPAEEPLRTGEMQAKVDPRAEWRQMFRDAWRQERDFFYDPGMHGVDWDHMYQRYGQLIPYVAHGADFSYVLGEMIGELNSSHSYVRPGDMPHAKQVGTGLLGCTFDVVPDSDRYRFGRIFSERDWNSDTPTPLNQPGQEVGSDDYILTIDGVDLKTGTNPYSLLENKVGAQVVLEIGPNPDGTDSREITVVPIANDRALRYEAWVQANRRRVDELSDGRIGYLHMPNTAVGGQVGFAKGYYPNLRKEGLIIDERFNGGGFIPDFFMNILRQKLVNLWKPRYGQDWRTPGTAFLGHMAMIANGYAGSGGDALPYYFKYYELGDVIGTRTWGGLVGISRGIGLMDGGQVTFPEFGLFNVNGEWDVENHGVEPTIEIDNLPHEEIAGRDPQLEKAVETLLQKIKDEPVVAPQTPGSFPRDKN